MEAEKENRRARKDNFTHSEVIALIEAYECRKNLLQSRLKSSVTNKDKKNAWAAVQISVNAVSTIHRSADELRRKWSKLTSEAKSDLAKRKYCKTGGGPKPRESPYTELIANILGDDSALIHGIDDGTDTGEEGLFDIGKTSQHSATCISEEFTAKHFALDSCTSHKTDINCADKCADEEGSTLMKVVHPSLPSSVAKSSSSPLPITPKRKRNSSVDGLYATYLEKQIKLKDLQMENLELKNHKLKLQITILQRSVDKDLV